MAPVKTDEKTIEQQDEQQDVQSAETDAENTLLEELIAFTRDERNDLAIRLLELNALHVEGEITDDEFAERRAELYAA